MKDRNEQGRGAGVARLRCARRSALAALFLCLVTPALAAAQGTRQPSRERGIGLEVEKSKAAQAALAQVSALPGRQKRYALVIGVDQYADPQVVPLAGASNDARLLADALVRYAGFPAEHVILLTTNRSPDWQPTRSNVLRKLSNLAGVVPKDGLLLFSFAGHGVERNSQAFLLPSDAQVSDDVNLLENTAINVVQIKDWIRRTGVGQVLLFLDACRTDPSAGRSAADNPLTTTYTKAFNFDWRNREVQAFATVYATAVGRRAYERRTPRHGYFTLALVEGLKGDAANDRGEVTLASLVDYLQSKVNDQVRLDLGQGREQKPFAEIGGYRANELVLSVKDPAAAAAAQRMEQQLAAEKAAEAAGTPRPTIPAATAANEPGIGRDEELPFEGGLAGTSWTGTSPEIIDGEYAIEFLKDGQLSYSFNQLRNGKTERANVKGTWRQVESFVQVRIGSHSVMEGKLDGGIIRGTLTNVEGLKRDFVLLRKTP
ncbi:MAG TPA: caspase family protein [Pyrinomonadaceae bacterium]|nr:caspase family protein [Pyrinomonadaceae bacterium]